jgi:hypothetical protein
MQEIIKRNIKREIGSELGCDMGKTPVMKNELTLIFANDYGTCNCRIQAESWAIHWDKDRI